MSITNLNFYRDLLATRGCFEGTNVDQLVVRRPALGTNLLICNTVNNTVNINGTLNVSGGISVSGLTTDGITEGSTNLYYTNARARAAISVSDSLANLGYSSSTGVISLVSSPTFNSMRLTTGASNGLYLRSDASGNASWNALPASVSSLTGTADQILVAGTSGSPQTGVITLTLPQSINTSSSPTFASLTATNSVFATTLFGRNTAVNANDTLYLGSSVANQQFFLDRPNTGGAVNIGYMTAKSSTFNPIFNVYNNTTDKTQCFSVYSAGTTNGQNSVFCGVNLGLSTTTPTQALEISGVNRQIYLNSSTSNFVRFNSQGSAAPTISGARSAGSKVILADLFSSGTSSDHSIGVDTGTVWYNTALNTHQHKWFLGASQMMALSTTGLSVGSSVITEMFSCGSANQFRVNSSGQVVAGSWNAGIIGLQFGGVGVSLVGTGSTGAVLRQNSLGATITVSQLAASDLSNGVSGSGSVVLSQSPTITGNLSINGNLLITGETINSIANDVRFGDRYLFVNATYTTNTGLETGMIFNFLPTNTTSALASSFVAGVNGVSNPRVNTVASGLFAAGDLVLITDSTSNDGIFEVDSNVGTLLVVRGVGLTGPTFSFTSTQFVAEASTGNVRKIGATVLRCDITGNLGVASGNTTTGMSFANLLQSGRALGAPSSGNLSSCTNYPASALSGSVSLTSQVSGLLPLSNGGSNANLSPIAGGVVFSDASKFDITAAGSAGQVLVSNGSSAPGWANLSGIGVSSITGTANQITASAATGAITLSLPSTIITPGTLAINGMTSGSVLFAGASSVVSQDNSTFIWNNTTKCLGVNWPTPTSPIECWDNYYSATKTLRSFGTGLKVSTYDTPIGGTVWASGPGTSTSGPGSDIIIGYTFTVSATQLYLTHLGFLKTSDVGPVFPSGTRTIGLYNAGGTLVASCTVNSSDPVENSFVYGAISTGITLAPGTTWTILALSPASAQVVIAAPFVSYSGITFGAARMDYSSSLTYITGNLLGYTLPLGPGFKYSIPYDTLVVNNRALVLNGTLTMPTPLSLASGGSNNGLVASAGSVCYSDASKLMLSAVGSSNQVLISNGTSAPSWSALSSLGVSSLAGTANQITASGSIGAITLSLPATIITPGTLAVNGMTQGSVLFAGASSVITQDNANFFYDDTNNRLGISTAIPRRKIDTLDPSNPQLRLTQADNTVFTDLQTNSSGHLLIQPTGGSIIPGTGALATNATQGFIYSSTVAGRPTGVPTTYTGRAATVYDTTNNSAFVYNGSWIAVVPTGCVMQFVSRTIPTGWLICEGAAVSRTTWAALFAVIGTSYGNGDGSTTFNVPDMRGRFARGQANGSANDPDRAARTAITGGAAGDNPGSVQGDQFRSHTHTWEFRTFGGGAFGAHGPDSFGTNGSNPQTGAAGGNETRPINQYFVFIIKT